MLADAAQRPAGGHRGHAAGRALLPLAGGRARARRLALRGRPLLPLRAGALLVSAALLYYFLFTILKFFF